MLPKCNLLWIPYPFHGRYLVLIKNLARQRNYESKYVLIDRYFRWNILQRLQMFLNALNLQDNQACGKQKEKGRVI